MYWSLEYREPGDCKVTKQHQCILFSYLACSRFILVFITNVFVIFHIRQFPSLFGEQPRGKKRLTSPAPAPCIVKRTNFNMYVLSGPSQFSPKGSEELEHAYAGLGKRMLSLPDNLIHSEVIILYNIVDCSMIKNVNNFLYSESYFTLF